VKPWAYTEEKEELEELILQRLQQERKFLVLAESCTGGMVAQRMTRLPGASAYVWGGYTVYTPEAKESMLGVKLKNPEDAVSQECTRRLAESAKKVSHCDVAAAITCYLGPSGGTEIDPIGTIYLCVIGKTVQQKKIKLPSRSREEAQWGAATWLLWEILSNLES
jgi:PncC family amidohydrolase